MGIRQFTVGLVMAVTLFVAAATARAGVVVAEELQVPILLKLLTYDRYITANPPESLKIGVVYRDDNDDSKSNRDQILEILRKHQGKTISGIPFEMMAISYESPDQLSTVLSDDEVHVVYVTSGLGQDLNDIQQVTTDRSVLSLTGAEGFVEKGISVGLELAENRPQIVVNLDSLRAEGHELRSTVLKLCKIVRGAP